METIQTALALPLVRGAILGFLSASAVDFAAFRSFKSREQIAQFDWSVALFRWGLGAITGLLGALGLEGVS